MSYMPIENLPVSIKTMVIKREGMTIYYPQIIRMENVAVQKKMNQTILQLAQYLIKQQHIQQDVEDFIEVIGTYEIKTNERNVLSLSLSNYAYAPMHANGLTLMKSLTFDIQTGRVYQLQDLFKQGSNYKELLAKIVQKQIKERDIPLINDFPGILPNQDFYIADKSLVLYYQMYQMTPHYIGLPMFPISVFKLQEVIDENGPLGWMATNS